MTKMTPKPVRIQRSRQRKMVSPNGLEIVYVGRPTKWGNPVDFREYGREQAVSISKHAIFDGEADVVFIEAIRTELKGKNLSCWCPIDQPCHADVLLEIANN